MLPIQITGHNIEVTDTLREVVTKKLSKLERHAERITNIHVIFTVNNLLQKAEVTLHIPGSEIHAKAESGDMYATIDMLVAKLVRQLDKHRNKKRV